MDRSQVNRKYREPAFGGTPFGWQFWAGLTMLLLPAAVLALMTIDTLTTTHTEWVAMSASERSAAVASNSPGVVIPDTKPVEVDDVDWGVAGVGVFFLTLFAALAVRLVVRERQVARQRGEQPELLAGSGGNLIVPAAPIVVAHAERLDRDRSVDDLPG